MVIGGADVDPLVVHFSEVGPGCLLETGQLGDGLPLHEDILPVLLEEIYLQHELAEQADLGSDIGFGCCLPGEVWYAEITFHQSVPPVVSLITPLVPSGPVDRGDVGKTTATQVVVPHQAVGAA